MVMERLKQNRWLKMALYIVILTGVSYGFYVLLLYLTPYLGIPEEGFAPIAYLVVFGVTLLANAAIFVPVVFHIAIMLWAIEHANCNLVLVVLVASVAGALGEITGYYAGYLGKRIVLAESTPGYKRFAGWMQKYGPWGIFLVSLQPLTDIAGLLAGASKLPLWKFLLPCWPAKFIKYFVICYFGGGILNLLPPLPF
jgi:membrane protein YqaA with SNARE-associated domain